MLWPAPHAGCAGCARGGMGRGACAPAGANAARRARQVREIYETAIEAAEPYHLPDADCLKMCTRRARARAAPAAACGRALEQRVPLLRGCICASAEDQCLSWRRAVASCWAAGHPPRPEPRDRGGWRALGSVHTCVARGAGMRRWSGGWARWTARARYWCTRPRSPTRASTRSSGPTGTTSRRGPGAARASLPRLAGCRRLCTADASL